MRTQSTPEPPINRGQLTKQIAAYLGPLLKAEGIELGRGIAPEGGGWQDSGQPGQSTFRPYVVLKAGGAVTPAPGERENLGRRSTSWQLNYVMGTHHRLESLVDETADTVRGIVVGFSRGEDVTLDGVAWTIQSVTVPRLGATGRDSSTDPAHWQVADDVSLHLSRAQRG